MNVGSLLRNLYLWISFKIPISNLYQMLFQTRKTQQLYDGITFKDLQFSFISCSAVGSETRLEPLYMIIRLLKLSKSFIYH